MCDVWTQHTGCNPNILFHYSNIVSLEWWRETVCSLRFCKTRQQSGVPVRIQRMSACKLSRHKFYNSLYLHLLQYEYGTKTVYSKCSSQDINNGEDDAAIANSDVQKTVRKWNIQQTHMCTYNHIPEKIVLNLKMLFFNCC